LIKFTGEIKLAITQGFDPTIISETRYAKEMGVSKAQFQYWLKLYKLHGEEAFENIYEKESMPFKLDVLDFMVQSGASLMDTAALFKLSSYTKVYRWQKQLEKGDLKAHEPQTKGRPLMKQKSTKPAHPLSTKGSTEELEDRIKQLEMENAYLKKLNALVQNKEKSPKKTKCK
jgi:transposase-like protein